MGGATMLEINIGNDKGKKFKGTFQTKEELEAWVKSCQEKKSWGEKYTMSEVKDITLEVEKEKKYQELLKAGLNDRKCCEEILLLIGGYNRSRMLTAEQITKMIKDFSDIEACLSKGRPSSAKFFIDKLRIDEETITTELYELITQAFKKYGIV